MIGKKYFLYVFFLVFFLVLITPLQANQESEIFEKPTCFHYYDRLESFFIEEGQVYTLDSNKSDLVIVQSGKVVPHVSLQEESTVLDFTPPFRDVTDRNPQTFIELDTFANSEFVFELWKKAIAHEFQFLYDFDVKYHSFDFFVSNDGVLYDRVTSDSIHDFSFRFFKIVFVPLNPENVIRESVKVRELSFRSSRKQYAFTSLWDRIIEVYHWYNCGGENPFRVTPKKDIITNIHTPVLYTTLKANPKYNVYTLFDRDNDWVEDEKDNCPYHYNPDQKDNNKDGVGNVCSDTDGDGIIWYEDICPYTYNPKQYDINTNAVGDACEFDKDKDRIYDTLDNCVNISNFNQLDTDNDGVGDKCDNCKYYNPNQSDTNDNGVGDVCDSKNQEMKNHDKDRDGILDWWDNCVSVPNVTQTDTDKDGVGDVCDNCKNIYNTDQTDRDNNMVWDMCEDTDNDNYIGHLDNCMYVANPDQIDTDNNGIGNVCEDIDRDGRIHVEDNCPYNKNPDQKDSDGDGRGDMCDDFYNHISLSKVFLITLFLLVVVGVYIYIRCRKKCTK